MKTLLLDIETSPNTAYVWGLFKQNISISQVINSSMVLCWAAKWLDKEEIIFSSVLDGHKRMLKRLHKLLDTCDVVVHYNGQRFDIPTVNKEFLVHDLAPTSSYLQVDLLKTARQQLRFPSNKLDYISQQLGFDGKVKHEGFELWIRCMNRDKEAFEKMKKYNIQDVILLEQVYYRLRPWIKNHPNYNAFKQGETACTKCGSHEISPRGFAYTQVGKYQRYLCNSCGGWSQERKVQGSKEVLLRSA